MSGVTHAYSFVEEDGGCHEKEHVVVEVYAAAQLRVCLRHYLLSATESNTPEMYRPLLRLCTQVSTEAEQR